MTESQHPAAVAMNVFEYRGRGNYFAFVEAEESCACGELALLVPLRLRLSSQPFLDAARALLAFGYPPDAVLVMTRGGQVALRSTVGTAASMRVTDSRAGTPVFRRWREKPQQEPSGDAVGPTLVQERAAKKKEPARLLLHLSVERAV